MIDLDVKTLFLLFSLSNFCIGVLLFIFNYSNNNQKAITSIYLTGKLIVAVAWLLFSLRGDITLYMSYVMANTLILVGIFLEFYCFFYLNKKPDKKILITVAGFILIISTSLFFLINQPSSYKVFHMSFLLTVLYFIGGVKLMTDNRGFNSIKIIAVMAFLVAVNFASKLFLPLFAENDINLLSQNTLIILSYVISYLVGFCWTILYLLTLNQIAQKEILQKNMAIANDNKQLKTLNATKDKIFSIIAHDLKGPIGGIIQLGQILSGKLGKLSNKEKDEVIETITQTASTTNNVLNNLLQWAKSESGSLEIEKKPLIIYNIVEESRMLLSENIQQKNIIVQNTINKDIRVFADYNMVYTIIRNLIANAVKFTPKGGEVIIYGEEMNAVFKTYVSDNGIGIAPDIVTKLLNADFQYHTNGTDNEPGTGIGLKLCNEFVLKNGGVMGIDNNNNNGTTFHFTLPIYNKNN